MKRYADEDALNLIGLFCLVEGIAEKSSSLVETEHYCAKYAPLESGHNTEVPVFGTSLQVNSIQESRLPHELTCA